MIDWDNPGILTEEDIRQGKLVEQMRMHQGFPVLVEFWNVAREAIIAAGKKDVLKSTDSDARVRWAELSGFDKACNMIDAIASRASETKEAEDLEKEGAKHATE